jgi:hypothetical protein
MGQSEGAAVRRSHAGRLRSGVGVAHDGSARPALLARRRVTGLRGALALSPALAGLRLRRVLLLLLGKALADFVPAIDLVNVNVALHLRRSIV